MDLKSLRLTNLKAGPEDGLAEGQFMAYASTWIREPDSYGDIVAKGAFADTIKEWKDSGDTLPILFGHRTDDPDYWIGGAIDMTEDDHGLLVKAEFDLENPKAKQTYRMVKGRRISQMSFAYDTLEDGIVDLGQGQSARELRKLKLYEVSIVPRGANADTEILAVKALADRAAGQIITPQNLESLKSIRDALNVAIKTAEDSTNDTEDEASSVESPEGKAQERKSPAARTKSALAQVAYISSL